MQQCVKPRRRHPLKELLESGEVRDCFQPEHRSYFRYDLNQLYDSPIGEMQPLHQAQQREVLVLRVAVV
jgi:hypothetical protein